MSYARKRPPLDPCPVEEVIQMIGGKWKARILLLVALGYGKFAALRRELPGISVHVLSTQLKSMIEDGLIDHQRSGDRGTGSAYALTSLATELMPVLDQVCAWGVTRLEARGQSWRRPTPFLDAKSATPPG